MKSKILGAKPEAPTNKTVVPEWDVTVWFRVMSGMERDSFEQSVIGGGGVDLINISAKLLVRCLSDESGVRIFSDDDAESLGQQSAKVLRRLYPIAKRVNAIFEDDVKELVKNSESGPSEGSS